MALMAGSGNMPKNFARYIISTIGVVDDPAMVAMTDTGGRSSDKTIDEKRNVNPTAMISVNKTGAKNLSKKGAIEFSSARFYSAAE